MIWIEVLSRHHDVLSRQRCGDDVRIGRAYDNDVVLDDPFAAPHHVRIVRDESGALHAEDLGSVNGLFAGTDPRRRERVEIDGSQVLRVGHTLVRVRAPEFEVAPERVDHPATRTWPAIAALAVTVLLLSALTLWLNETRESQPSRYLLPMLGVALVVLVWATGWTVLSRIFTGIGHFDRHLLIALGGLLAFFVYGELTDFGAFAFSSRILAEYAYAGNWILFAALCFAHLRAMGPGRMRAKGGAVAALAIAAIAAQTVSRSDESSLAGQQSYLQGLKPPLFRLKRVEGIDGFLGETDRLRETLDKSRLDPPGGRGFLDSDPDD